LAVEKQRAFLAATEAATRSADAAAASPESAELATAADAARGMAEEASAASNVAAATASDAAKLAQAAEDKAKTDEAASEAAKSSLPMASAKPPSASGPSVTVNTNLEQISDWLTKIIVGVALVEIKTLVEQMQKAAEFIAQSLGGTSAASFSFALMLYFIVSGLLGSYLLTRLFLQNALADAARG
jgi:hypothetical protein